MDRSIWQQQQKTEFKKKTWRWTHTINAFILLIHWNCKSQTRYNDVFKRKTTYRSTWSQRMVIILNLFHKQSTWVCMRSIKNFLAAISSLEWESFLFYLLESCQTDETKNNWFKLLSLFELFSTIIKICMDPMYSFRLQIKWEITIEFYVIWTKFLIEIFFLLFYSIWFS